MCALEKIANEKRRKYTSIENAVQEALLPITTGHVAK